MERIFKGWVPTVLGRLSFSNIGYSSHPALCTTENQADNKTRYVLCYQKRDTLDVVAPFKHLAASFLASLEGRMWFVLSAKTCAHEGRGMEKLQGCIFLFHSFKMWNGQAEKNFRKAQKRLRDIDNKLGKIDIEAEFDSTFQELVNDITNLCSFRVNFILMRNGEVTLIHDDSVIISSSAPNIPVRDIECANYIVHMVASQIFYFLKDICHRHQHHKPRTDTVLDLYHADDDLHWREQTLFSLYRNLNIYWFYWGHHFYDWLYCLTFLNRSPTL